MRSQFFQYIKLDKLINCSRQTGERTFEVIFIYEDFKKYSLRKCSFKNVKTHKSFQFELLLQSHLHEHINMFLLVFFCIFDIFYIKYLFKMFIWNVLKFVQFSILFSQKLGLFYTYWSQKPLKWNFLCKTNTIFLNWESFNWIQT